MLSLQSFEKSYGGHPVLRVAGFSIQKGIYWLQGPNGTGKSTLIKCIAGLLPFKGSITLHDNISLKKNRIAYRQKINFADAEPLFPDFLTGAELIGLFIRAKNGHTTDVEELTASLNMRHYLESPAGTYSSGMLKKLSLVLAFIGSPEWILLDEPFITLDTDSLSAMQTMISKVAQQRGPGILFSSHQTIAPENLPPVQQIYIEEGSLKRQYA